MELWKQMRPVNWCYIFSIFAVSGSAVYFALFGRAPEFVPESLVVGLATSFAGTISWAVIGGGTRVPDRLISVAIGIATGVLLHPIYFLLAGVFDGSPVALLDSIRFSLFSLLVVGVFTIPAGILASMLIREILELVSPPNSTEESGRT